MILVIKLLSYVDGAPVGPAYHNSSFGTRWDAIRHDAVTLHLTETKSTAEDISIGMLDRAFLLGLTLSAAMLAQQSAPDPPVIGSGATSGPQSPQWRGLSVEEKLR
jgi:hypothetical protein